MSIPQYNGETHINVNVCLYSFILYKFIKIYSRQCGENTEQNTYIHTHTYIQLKPDLIDPSEQKKTKTRTYKRDI